MGDGVGELGIAIDGVQLCCFDQEVGDDCGLAARLGADEEDQGPQEGQLRGCSDSMQIAGLIWRSVTKEAPYRWARPAFVAMKMRKLELRAEAHGTAGPGRDYSIKELRQREMNLGAQAEAAYAAMVKAWKKRPPKRRRAEKWLLRTLAAIRRPRGQLR